MERGKGARWGRAKLGTCGDLGTEMWDLLSQAQPWGGIGLARDEALWAQEEGDPEPPSHIPAVLEGCDHFPSSKTPRVCSAPPRNPGIVSSGDTSATSPQAGEQIPAPLPV